MAAPIAPSKLQALQETITTFLLDPRNHDLLTILKGLRNGLVYGTKVRFPHALVMVLLFRTGTLRSKATQILTATRTHATNLGLFVTLYKTTMLALRHLSPTGKERSADSFVAGALGGYVVFGRGGSGNSVNMQIVVYVFARVVLALAKLAVSDGPLCVVRGEKAREGVGRVAWPLFAGGSWAMVMWLFRWYPEAVQASMRSSMVYLYDNAETWTGIRDFLIHNK
ncbi:peroxisomal membrane protein 4 [Morchella conica CCBAS932]|uniref:Peroxisomal membrane protein 4 n=1 Tax=Morchella conica CCBAS932 TaxID=1392247 RepID=A0A3N4L4H1_9PEZI|nr:peroxisomal membrane protein 4 [Morchella conica CCBAS932]